MVFVFAQELFRIVRYSPEMEPLRHYPLPVPGVQIVRSGAKYKRARKNKSKGGGEVREGSRASLPSPPLLYIAFFTSLRSPQSERLEQATLPPAGFL